MLKKKIMVIMLMAGLAVSGACRKEGSNGESLSVAADVHPASLNPEDLDIPGLKAERVERRVLSIPVKASGSITFNPGRLACLTARVPGRIEAVYAFEGDRVKEGQAVLALYSLDYLSAQQELIQLFLQEARAREAGDEETVSLTSGLIGSALRKIKLMGVSEEEVQKVRESRTLNDRLLIKAPFSGSLVAQSAVTGDYVEVGRELFQLADLETLWATANIFEKDLPLVRPGMTAEVRVQAFPQDVFSGRLTVIGAVEDADTRTVRGRIELPNPGERLKPGMFAEIILTSPAAAEILALPASAVRYVEGKSVVFVKEAAGPFVLREVKTGRLFGSWMEVLEGLKEGDMVATEGSFSLKAEILKKQLGEQHE